VRTELFSALGAVLLVAAGWVWFGRGGLTAGLLVFGVVSFGLAVLAAGRERRGSA